MTGRDWRQAAEVLGRQGSARTPEPAALRLRQGTVTAAAPASRTATITLGGDTTSPIPGVACMGTYHPVVGDTVWVAVNGTDLLILGSLTGERSTYTPTLSGFTQGSGAISGAWSLVDGMVDFEAQWTYGSGSAAASAVPVLSLPVNADVTFQYPGQLQGYFWDVSAGLAYATTVLITSAGGCGSYIVGSNAVTVVPSLTAPFTWTTGDMVKVGGRYWPA